MHTETTDSPLSIGFTVVCDHFVLMLGINYVPLQYGLTVPGPVTPCLCNLLLFLSTTEKGALLLCSTLFSPKNQGSQTGRSIRKRKSHCKPMPNYVLAALKPAI